MYSLERKGELSLSATHHKGGCKQLESKAAGKILDTGGDCTDSGKNTAAPTPAPTPPPTPVVWAGSDLAADVALMTDHATTNCPVRSSQQRGVHSTATAAE